MKPTVQIITHPKSYELRVNSYEYLYYDLGQLAAGIFYHVMLGETEYIDTNYLIHLIAVAAEWPNHKDLYDAMAQQMTANQELQTEVRQAGMRNSSLFKSLEETREVYNNLKASYAGLEIRLETAQKQKEELTKELSIMRTQLVNMKREKIATETAKERKADKYQEKKFDEIMEKRKAKEKEKAKERAEKQAAKLSEQQVTEKVKAQEGIKFVRKRSCSRVHIDYSPEIYEALMLPLTIDKTGLSTRTLNVMRLAGNRYNETVGDVAQLTRKDLLMTRGCGNQVADFIETFLTKHGLALNLDVKSILKAHDAGGKL